MGGGGDQQGGDGEAVEGSQLPTRKDGGDNDVSVDDAAMSPRTRSDFDSPRDQNMDAADQADQEAKRDVCTQTPDRPNGAADEDAGT